MRFAPLALFALAACPHTATPTSQVPPQARPHGGAMLYATAHIDPVQPGKAAAFAEIRRSWVERLRKNHTTDARGLYFQTGDGGFLSLAPFRRFCDLELRGMLADAALSRVDREARRLYDADTDALLAPPHRSEIWRFDEGLSYGTLDPARALAAAGWAKMIVEQLDPTPAGDDYEAAWKEVRAALEAEHYPLVRVSYWSSYGSGDLVTFWIAKTAEEFLETPAMDVVAARVLGRERTAQLFARMRKVVTSSEAIDAIPRPDLSSSPLD